jgi:hypothetical protein
MSKAPCTSGLSTRDELPAATKYLNFEYIEMTWVMGLARGPSRLRLIAADVPLPIELEEE